MRYATVRLDLTTTTAVVIPDDGGPVQSCGVGLTRSTAPAALAESGWQVPRNVRWKEYSEGYRCRAVRP